MSDLKMVTRLNAVNHLMCAEVDYLCETGWLPMLQENQVVDFECPRTGAVLHRALAVERQKAHDIDLWEAYMRGSSTSPRPT